MGKRLRVEDVTELVVFLRIVISKKSWEEVVKCERPAGLNGLNRRTRLLLRFSCCVSMVLKVGMSLILRSRWTLFCITLLQSENSRGTSNLCIGCRKLLLCGGDGEREDRSLLRELSSLRERFNSYSNKPNRMLQRRKKQ